MDKKHAQMTVFIVLGLVLLAVVSMAIYLRMNAVEDRVGSLEEQVELSTQRTALSLMVDSCLRSKAVKAIEIYGIDESAEQLITSFIEYEMLPCIDVTPFTNEGIRVYNDEGYVTTEISDNAVAVQMHLPLTLVREDSRATLDDFSFTLQKVRYVSLPTDGDGRMQETYSFTSPNNRAEITIPENTIVKKDDAGVSPEDMISLRLVDRNYNNMQNAISIGEIMYLMESGISFSPAATMTLYYDEEELPPWENEEQLTLSVYDEDTGIWRVLPSVVEADKDRIIAEIDHFSLFTITSSICADTDGNDQVIASGLLYKERCRPCEGAVLNDRGELYFTSRDVQYYGFLGIGGGSIGYDIGAENKDCGAEHCCHLGDWDHDDEDGNGRTNEQTDIGVSDAACSGGGDHIWSPSDGGTCYTWDRASPETYGYDVPEHVGGSADFEFYTVEKTGNVCSNNNTKEVVVDILTSPGDQAINTKLNGRHITTANFRQGENHLTFDVENTNGDGCAEGQVVMTVRGAGFLPSCPVNERLTKNCQCGQQNANVENNRYGGHEIIFFCCESGVVVSDLDYEPTCEPAYNLCPIGDIFLSAGNNGCFCGSASQQYNHYSQDAKHYCCGLEGLSSTPCTRCAAGGNAESEDCLCDGIPTEEGQGCCYVGIFDGRALHAPLNPEDCPTRPQCDPEGAPATTSAVIADITGMTIQRSQLCSNQQVGLWEDLMIVAARSFCQRAVEGGLDAVGNAFNINVCDIFLKAGNLEVIPFWQCDPTTNGVDYCINQGIATRDAQSG